MTSFDPLRLTLGAQLPRRKGPDRLERRVAILDRAVGADEASVDQRRERPDRIGHGRVGGDEGLDRLEVGAPCEHRNASQERLLGRGEEVVAPAHRRVERTLAGRRIGPLTDQLIDPRGQAVENRPRRQQPDLGRRQLDRERHAVQPDADLGDSGCVGGREVERRPHGPGSLDEQLDRRAVGGFLRGGARAGRRHRQGSERVFLLPGEVQRNLARDQQPYAQRLLQQALDECRSRGQVLEVIEDEQQPSITQEVDQPIGRRTAVLELEPKRAHGGGRDERGVRNRLERDEPRAVGEVIGDCLRHGDRQARLAGPAGTRDRDEPAGREESKQFVQLPGPTDEARQPRRQVPRPCVLRAERREGRPEARNVELVQPFRSGHVLQRVPTQVPDRDALGQ